MHFHRLLPTVLIACFAACAFQTRLEASQTLEMQLQPVPSAGQKSELPGSVRAGSSGGIRLPSSRGGAPSEPVTIGKVGYVEAEKTSIRKTRNLRAAALFSVPKNTPLAVINTQDKWYGVLMVDGSTGWLPTSDLRISETRVTLDQPSLPGSSSEIIQRALTYRGIPYVWGGASRSGTDCSGFVKQVWAEFGRGLPRTAREQAVIGTPVPVEQIKPGDRLYFSCKGGAVDHTGIYMGEGQFIHASGGRRCVDIDNLQSWKYSTCLVDIRRG